MELKGIVHMTAATFDGHEVFHSGHYTGPDMEGAVRIVRRVHDNGSVPWATAKGAPIDFKNVDPETIRVFLFEPA